MEQTAPNDKLKLKKSPFTEPNGVNTENNAAHWWNCKQKSPSEWVTEWMTKMSK